MTDRLLVNIVPNEIVLPATTIEVSSREPLDHRSAQGAITVNGERPTVRVSEDGLVASLTPADRSGFAPGPHVLTIDEPLSAEGKRLAGRIEVPFMVTDTRAEIPAGLRVEAMVRLAVEDLRTTRVGVDKRPDGRFVEVFKAADRRTGEPVALAFNESGNRVDADEIFAGITRRRLDKFGKLQEELHERVEREPAAPVDVAIWLRLPEPTARREKSSTQLVAGPTEAEQRETREAQQLTARMAELVRREFAGEEAKPDPAAPVVFATIRGERLRALAQRDDVAAIFLHETDEILDLVHSMASANSVDVHNLGFNGKGVNVAVWETGPDKTNLLPIVAAYDPPFNGNSAHARLTHAVVSNTEPNQPHGHAPGCRLYSANRSTTEALQWAAQKAGCTVISQSFHRKGEPQNGTLQFDDIYKDWLALRPPFPTIVQAAGNYFSGDADNIQPPSSEYVNHKTFNCLTVGNDNDIANAMATSSVFRNPTSVHGDRELPEICANGEVVSAVGLTMSGTSFAAPAVAGCVALIQGVDAVLQSWPEGCRAIMMAAANRNPSGGTWWADVSQKKDASDGSGTLDALESLRIAQSRQSWNAAGVERGWDIGTLRSSDIGAKKQTIFSYTIKAPKQPLGAKAKVALAWDSVVTTGSNGKPLSSILTVDLDLMVYDSNGSLVAYSGSWDNSYEIAEFTVTPGDNYTVKIRRWSGTDDVWYGVAWAVTES